MKYKNSPGKAVLALQLCIRLILVFCPLSSISFPIGAGRTSQGGICIAGEWNGDKAYGEERDEGKGIIAAGEGDLRRAAPLSLHQRLLQE